MTSIDDALFPTRLSTRQNAHRPGRQAAPGASVTMPGRTLSPECGSSIFPLAVDVYDWISRAPCRRLPIRCGALRVRQRRVGRTIEWA